VALILGVLALAPLSPAAAHGAILSANRVWIECQNTVETDNVQVNGSDNPFVDDMGNNWTVYYDIQRDSVDNVACQIRVVARIFNPVPDGAWKGAFKVFANRDNSYVSASYGKLSGSSSYAAHLVWRGPWFGVNPGSSYHIQIDEFNGSTVCLQCHRAMTNFNL
jgi:hypothetical protein